MFVYFGFSIWHAAVAFFDGVATEQFIKSIRWGKYFLKISRK